MKSSNEPLRTADSMLVKLLHRCAANATSLFASLGLFTAVVLTPADAAGAVITNHSFWYDTQGNLIDCHEGGILRVGNTFYWYGREYVGNTQGTYGAAGAQYRCGLRCYSSTNLVNWTYRGKILSYPASGWLTNGTWHRPRVLYNAATSTYVLWFFMFPPGGTLPMTHVVATASTPTGPFTVITGPDYKVGGDLALLQDTDGQAYICNDDYYTRSSWVTRLTSNFQGTTSSTVNAIPSSSYGNHEGQSIVRYKGKIIVAGSGVAGLNFTETSYAVASAPLGPYTYKGNMSQQNTWSSQMGSFLYIAETDTLMALCDQWRRGPNGETVIAQQSCYLWLPVTFDPVTNVAQMQHVNQWDPFASTPAPSSKKCDMNGDGKEDILWFNPTTAANSAWMMNGTTYSSTVNLNSVSANWKMIDGADFNSDGKTDILWRNAVTGANTVWLMNGTTLTSGVSLPSLTDLNWKMIGAGDFNADGKPDILWRNTSTGANTVWLMNGTTQSSSVALEALIDQSWKMIGAGDFNADGKADILWRNYSTSANTVWMMNGTTHTSSVALSPTADLNWKMIRTGDFNSDGKSDILWRHATTGANTVWLMNGTTISSGVSLNAVTDLNWKMASGQGNN